ncbi:hypothetical protein FQA39_LY12206 [Lamprigera yunnana]|nr:hypothetical protein FQA39_LY12206 [Lamprigera yunnana]
MSEYQNFNTDFYDEKRKLLYWLSQLKGPTGQVNADTFELSVLLQIFEHKLDTFEKIENILETSTESSKIVLLCSACGKKIVYVKIPFVCKCPAAKSVNKERCWSITEFHPKLTSQSSIALSTNSVTTAISEGKSKFIKCLMAKIVSIIHETEIKNTNSSSPCPDADASGNEEIAAVKKAGIPTIKTTINYVPCESEEQKKSSKTDTSAANSGLCKSVSQILSDSNASEHIKDIAAIKKVVDAKWQKLQNSSYCKNGNNNNNNEKPKTKPETSKKSSKKIAKTVTPKRKETKNGHCSKRLSTMRKSSSAKNLSTIDQLKALNNQTNCCRN